MQCSPTNGLAIQQGRDAMAYGCKYTRGNKQLRIDTHSPHDYIRYKSATVALQFYLARMGTPQAAPACLPSANTRFPLTNVDRTWPESSFPRYAEMFCKP